MKLPVFFFLVVVCGSSGVFALQPPPIIRFDEIQKFDPEIGQKPGLMRTQLGHLAGAQPEREGALGSAGAKSALDLLRGAAEEHSAKKACHDARWDAPQRFQEGVVEVLTDSRKSLIAAVEETSPGLRGEIREAAGGVEDPEGIFQKAREIWMECSAHLRAGSAAEGKAAPMEEKPESEARPAPAL